MSKLRETDLYPPVRDFLIGQGYDVKSEVSGADVVAMRDDDPDPVIVELKTGMNLTLVQQGVARQALTDWVYLAVPAMRGRKTMTAHVSLCRRLGLGLMTVRPRDGYVEVHVDPGPYTPRQSKPRRGRLLREFQRRVGDPNSGGSVGVKLVTAYRQDALRCAAYLAQHGPARGAVIAKAQEVPRATVIMRDDHYGWFERVERGVYGLTPTGRAALDEFGGVPPATARAAE
ncbi:hypothetical protein OB2597_07495 [Pseudooceanicola batsensis HTCC2597]|uniref:Uncharacterized protein n=1 Tax=Pseudooceanicola batsensis (strain ATCC BAA-863 / DSM 15984 / KCTC 12145 / HTCC2597) TaxID=252305 RepID=A3TTY4_PSEBH|nr:DUF2161 family putative PD-(D/E)XK-type phosphodiesterase [Pseudooceanicola batsensis]EAQ05111.1 hypothetical protein OB2597_07495 [Pseudooceanicola batsensis HTCC2597]